MESQRVYEILVVLLLILPSRIFSQQEIPRIEQISPHALKFFATFYRAAPEHYNHERERMADLYSYKAPGIGIIFYRSWTGRPGGMEVIRPNFYTEHVGFFCRKELQFEKITYALVRIRLGSLDYVDRMEGKNKFEVHR